MRRFLTIGLTVTLAWTAGCTGGGSSVGSDDPGEHIKQLTEAVQKGDLIAAYNGALPDSYKKDVDGVMAKVKTTLTEAEFNRIRDMAKTVGAKLAPMVEQMAAQDPSMKPAVEQLKDLPKTLGLESFSDFSGLEMNTFLANLSDNLVKKVAAESPAQNFESKVDKTEGDNATVTLTTTKDGKSESETIELTKVEGKWVPKEMSASWKQQIADANKQIDDFLAKKKADPEMLMKQLDEMETQLDQMLMMAPMMLQGLKNSMSGGGGAK